MKEIGGEFCTTEYVKQEPFENSPNSVFLLSGRTAIDFIIKDIKVTKPFNNVLLPYYCCESMIVPFLHNNISVHFYFVNETDIKCNLKNVDAVLLIDYFGYINEQNLQIATEAKNQKITVIYDATHNLDGMDFSADYIFCSYRKWIYCNTAIAVKSTPFCISQPTNISKEYIRIRDKASELKKRYMNGELVDKLLFLSLFSKAEEMLAKDYNDYAGFPVIIDTEHILQKRRKNAACLLDSLRNIHGIRFWRMEVKKEDSPLFVPILVNDGKRDALKKHLIQNGIYCPVHWPKSKYHYDFCELYEEEISLICDQRYSEEDMIKVSEVIKSFFKRTR